MHIESEIKLGFKDVMIRPKRSSLKSRSDVGLQCTYTFQHSQQQWQGIPIMAANMDTIGTFAMAKALSAQSLFTCLHKHYHLDEWQRFLAELPAKQRCYIAVSSGIGLEDAEKLQHIMALDHAPDFICIDVANGYTQHFIDFVRKTREQYPSKTIIAGNVVTGEIVKELLLAGADIIKVGIGPGSVCTTRVKTGVGYPQLSAVIECAGVAHELGGHIISDGGCTVSGDIAKAFGGGADFVMLGGMLAGHDECEGEIIEQDGKKSMLFYGMSSRTAMEKHAGGVAEYRASEGRTVRLPYRGKVVPTVLDMLGGIRSTCTYVGAQQLEKIKDHTTFIRVNEQHNPIYEHREILGV